VDLDLLCKGGVQKSSRSCVGGFTVVCKANPEMWSISLLGVCKIFENACSEIESSAF